MSGENGGNSVDISCALEDGLDVGANEESAPAIADAPRGKRRVATRGVWRAGRVRNMLVETQLTRASTLGANAVRAKRRVVPANQTDPF